MIADWVQNVERYRGIHANIDRAIDFVKTADLSKLVIGRNEIDGERLFANLYDHILEKDNEGGEIHRKYADFQVLLSGEEGIGFAGKAQIGSYEAENDIAHCSMKKDNMLRLQEGQFAIFFPGEAHSPGNRPDSVNCYSKKLVIKVLMDEENFAK